MLPVSFWHIKIFRVFWLDIIKNSIGLVVCTWNKNVSWWLLNKFSKTFHEKRRTGTNFPKNRKTDCSLDRTHGMLKEFFENSPILTKNLGKNWKLGCFWRNKCQNFENLIWIFWYLHFEIFFSSTLSWG